MNFANKADDYLSNLHIGFSVVSKMGKNITDYAA